MRTIEISLQAIEDSDQIEAKIEQACVEMDLQITHKSTLKEYANSIHWHLKLGKEKGTLEITLWPAGQSAWFSIHENRVGGWMNEVMNLLQKRLENK